MSSLLDLSAAVIVGGETDPRRYDWSELAYLWDSNDMRAVHDWLNERWSQLIGSRLLGADDPDAKFLQGLAFAALALFFTQNCNQEGARLVLDDAVLQLSLYKPSHLGVRVQPILDTLQELKPLIATAAPDDDCPMQPFVYCRFQYQQ